MMVDIELRFHADDSWYRMMAGYESRRIRGPRRVYRLGMWRFRRSFYTRHPRIHPWASKEWEDFDLQPPDGVGVVIVEIDEVDSANEPETRETIVDVHAIGAESLVIDWRQAAIDRDYTAEMITLVNREYTRIGYIEGDRFCTIIDRLDDLLRAMADGADEDDRDLGRGPMDTY